MPRGYWDWGSPDVPIASSLRGDLGELASRLGSIVYYDRIGQVVQLDSLENGITPWRLSLTGAGSAAALSVDASRSGRYSLAETAGAVAGGSVSCTRGIQPLQDSPIGVEMSVAVTAADAAGTAVACNVTLHLFVQDGTTIKRGALKWLLPSGVVQYLDSSLVFQPSGVTVDVFHSVDHFHTLKFVMDITNGNYVRGIIDNIAIPIGGIALPTPAGADNPDVHVSIVNDWVSGAAPVVYWDDLVVTQAEAT